MECPKPTPLPLSRRNLVRRARPVERLLLLCLLVGIMACDRATLVAESAPPRSGPGKPNDQAAPNSSELEIAAEAARLEEPEEPNAVPSEAARGTSAQYAEHSTQRDSRPEMEAKESWGDASGPGRIAFAPPALPKPVIRDSASTVREEAVPAELSRDLASISPETVPRLHWNVWAAAPPLWYSSEHREPETRLENETRYRVYVDLAPIAYRVAGIAHPEVAAELDEGLRKLIDSGKDHLKLQLIVLADPQFYTLNGSPVIDLDLKLASLKQPIDATKIGEDFREQIETALGEQGFDITTLAKPGVGSIDIVVWKDSQPLDEVLVSFCVGPAAETEGCRGMGVVSNGLKGVDSLRFAADGKGLPDAGLHLIEVNDQLHSILKLAGESNYRIWRTQTSIADLRNELGLFVAAADDEIQYRDETSLRQVGLRLFELLFPTKDRDARTAGEAFVEFFQKQTALAPSEPPSLFVRVVTHNESESLFLPLGLLAWPLPGSAATVPVTTAVSLRPEEAAGVTLGTPNSTGPNAEAAPAEKAETSDLLGRLARIEMPLPIQSYSRPDDSEACVRRWVIAAPPVPAGAPNDQAIFDAISSIGDFAHIAGPEIERIDDIEVLKNRWTGTTQPSSVYVVTSHHANDALRFPPDHYLKAGSISAELAAPTVVILNGCDTAGPNTTALIRRLNERGASAIIATTTSLQGFVAGRYLDCLASGLRKAGAKLSVREAHRRAIECLAVRKDGGLVDDGHGTMIESGDVIGSRAALYQFFGNGNIEICPALEAGTP